MIEYVIDGKKYSLSYQELKEKYLEIVSLSDKEFKKRLPEILHLACVICWLKEAPSYVVLSDTGIIHELAHELHIGRQNTNSFQDLRDLFKLWCKLD